MSSGVKSCSGCGVPSMLLPSMLPSNGKLGEGQVSQAGARAHPDSRTHTYKSIMQGGGLLFFS